MNDGCVSDARARERALDVERSFVVQAPAGSGKTGLLIQRMLALLAVVDAPEEVVAITFTRKAAGEMRERIHTALQAAEEDPPQDEHQRATWALARAVQRRDAEAGWGLGENSGRLRIHTIDALCANLARQMPLLSRFGALPSITEDAGPLYQEAARAVLASLNGTDREAHAVARLLAHLDNDVQAAQTLLARMLAQRDQWLRHVAHRDSPRLERALLEAGLERLVRDELSRLVAAVPRALATEWLEVARYAGANMRERSPQSPLASLATLAAIPGNGPDDLDAWRALAHLVLTQEGAPRSGLNVKVGIPAPGTEKDKAKAAQLKQWKQRAEQLIAAACNRPGLREALHATRLLPEARYSEEQWTVLRALVDILPLAVAHLQVLFRERRAADFTAVSGAALAALGEEEAPTDLALALDYRIRHLLVDEFQDTSHVQFDLLERLTAGWQPGDGRTLFLVGDPMQSIYRFREAEVALYLRARARGIGGVRLEPLTLSTNFRSQAGIIDWINRAFPAVLPAAEDLASGAVPFSPSCAVHPALPGPAVQVHPIFGADRRTEAEVTVDLARAALAADPDRTVAILVRSRSHLRAVVPAMKAAGLRPHATEIDPLSARAVVRDLQALTRALLHPADRIAWLAVLRAPWCGLTLADLDTLARHHRSACILDLLADDEVVGRLSADARQRVRRLDAIVRAALRQRRRSSVARWVEAAWLALGGPATVGDQADLDDAQVYFDAVGELEQGGDLADFAALRARVDKLHAVPDADADPRLQVMTIHKAKGLEFDVVILPGLGREPRGRERPLLAWLEREWTGGSDLLLAPLKERTGDDTRLNAYLARLETTKAKHEDARLLYVAATRARHALHLIGHVQLKSTAPMPARASLLSCLWPAVQPQYEAACAGRELPSEAHNASRVPPAMVLRRLPLDWVPPAPAPGVSIHATAPSLASEAAALEFSWASESARHGGTVVHAFLERFAREGIDTWNVARLRRVQSVIARDLRALGVPDAELSFAVERVMQALSNALDDPRARWILGAHREAECELALTADAPGGPVSLVIDRTFVDDAGARWIVDYKTGSHEGGDLEAFLDREQVRYRDQLERYALVMRATESRPIRLGLYFPLLRAWREWRSASC